MGSKMSATDVDLGPNRTKNGPMWLKLKSWQKESLRRSKGLSYPAVSSTFSFRYWLFKTLAISSVYVCYKIFHSNQQVCPPLQNFINETLLSFDWLISWRKGLGPRSLGLNVKKSEMKICWVSERLKKVLVIFTFFSSFMAREVNL